MASEPTLPFNEYQRVHHMIAMYHQQHNMPPPTKHWIRHHVGVLTPSYHVTMPTHHVIVDMKKFQAAQLKYGF